ncbi:MAG: beta-lactamase family protein [Lentisphaeria bacterium]|nr:beta-lactamase family protein [Lentisphaeria bacterium]
MDYQKIVQQILDDAVSRGTECGCQASIFIDGKLAVNAYAGWTDWTRTKKVDENTVFPVYSTGKAMSSTVLHRLVEMGVIDYDTRISDIWKEFGCNGKEDMRIWHVLSYRSALYKMPEFNLDGAPLSDFEKSDFQYMTRLMAKATPEELFGGCQKYHPVTYGWLTGGIACHALNRTDYPQIFRELVGEPAGMDRFFYGISPFEDNAATLVPNEKGESCSEKSIEMMNKPCFRMCCNPSTCAMSNALSIAKHYAAIDRGELLKKETIDNAVNTKWRDMENDPFAFEKGRWTFFGLGYVLSGPLHDITEVFGHGGVGGSEGLLDRKHHLAFGFTRNCFANPVVISDVYSSVGFKNRDWDPMEIPDNSFKDK